MADNLHDLALIVKSRFPLVQIETSEETRMLGLLERVANLEGWALFTWSIADGLRRALRTDVVPQTYQFQDALRHIDKTPQNGIYVMLDAHPWLEEPVNVRLIKEIAQDYAKTARTLVFVSRQIDLPADLKRLSARFQLPLPTTDEIRVMIREEAQMWEREAGGARLKGEAGVVEPLVQHLAGMCQDDARRLVRQAVRDDGALTFTDLERVLRFKRETLGDAGLLDLEVDTGSFADVGGLAGLKRWLRLRHPAFTGDPAKLGVEAPRGVMLLGVQGAGKSLAAKAIAGAWRVPLARLDFAVLYNKFHGETERNLRQALRQCEAMAPCVLWIDEIEKGLAQDAAGGDGGVSRRVLGTLLTWMAERKSRVFLVATSNDVSQLPPELLRKGRLDEIFFVDLPDAATREEIFGIHLRKRKLDPDRFDVAALARAAEGFSGAEIEQAVVAAVYEALAEKQQVAASHIAGELARTRPLSVVMAEKVALLRQWAADRTVPAGW